jgi:Flp pilus assembly protein protease CpaA
MTWLLLYLLIVSLYDLRTHRIPNWCTLPLILAGFLAHFPGSMDLWLACFLLTLAWSGGWIGAGDVKLWMAVLWSLPESNFPPITLLILLSFLLTGIVQVIWRLIQTKPITGIKSPAAWRAIPFLLAFWYVH